MDAVRSNAANATSLEKLRSNVSEVEQQIEKMEALLTSSKNRRDGLVAERGPLVLPARTGNAAARKRLREIDEQLGPLERDIADDKTAKVELEEQHVFAEKAVRVAEWEERRASVRELLVSRMESGSAEKIHNAARNLAAALDAAREDDTRLAGELRGFGLNLDDLRTEFRFRRDVVARELRENLELPRSYFYGGSAPSGSLAGYDSQLIGHILGCLDERAVAP